MASREHETREQPSARKFGNIPLEHSRMRIKALLIRDQTRNQKSMSFHDIMVQLTYPYEFGTQRIHSFLRLLD